MANDDLRMAFDGPAEPMPSHRQPRDQRVHRQQRGAGAERGKERGVSRDGAAHDRAEHNAEDDVERRSAAHEAFLAEPHHENGDKVNQDRANGHLRDVDLFIVETEPESDPQRCLDPSMTPTSSMTGALTAWLTGQRGRGDSVLHAWQPSSTDRGLIKGLKPTWIWPSRVAPQQQVSPDRSAAEAPPCVSSRTNIERSGCPFSGDRRVQRKSLACSRVPGRLQNREGVKWRGRHGWQREQGDPGRQSGAGPGGAPAVESGEPVVNLRSPRPRPGRTRARASARRRPSGTRW